MRRGESPRLGPRLCQGRRDARHRLRPRGAHPCAACAACAASVGARVARATRAEADARPVRSGTRPQDRHAPGGARSGGLAEALASAGAMADEYRAAQAARAAAAARGGGEKGASRGHGEGEGREHHRAPRRHGDKEKVCASRRVHLVSMPWQRVAHIVGSCFRTVVWSQRCDR